MRNWENSQAQTQFVWVVHIKIRYSFILPYIQRSLHEFSLLISDKKVCAILLGLLYNSTLNSMYN